MPTPRIDDFAALKGKTVAVIGAAASPSTPPRGLRWAARCICSPADHHRRDPSPARALSGAYDNSIIARRRRWHQAIRFRLAGSYAHHDAIERTVKFPISICICRAWTNAAANNGVETTINGITHRFDSSSPAPYSPTSRAPELAISRQHPALARSLASVRGRG